ncbi:hypothetical protein CEXT_118311 [Caerostris extrusa]|uniref:Uncharacterized protein n=1 Tax=Caerostris extrusa TaxID=172846 RepID=A0AAV4UFS0_CAEEX|nr:hypothetical protein CEXT_118311 [Caerostris extrusa]
MGKEGRSLLVENPTPILFPPLNFWSVNSASFQLSFIWVDFNAIRSFLLALPLLITVATARAWRDLMSFLASNSSSPKGGILNASRDLLSCCRLTHGEIIDSYRDVLIFRHGSLSEN